MVGPELGVRAVLTGRVIGVADRLVIKTELVDVADGAQLWGEHYKRKLSDIFEVEEEIAPALPEGTLLLEQKTAYEQKKRYEEAIAEAQKAVELLGDSSEAVACLGHAYATSGRKEEAQRVLDDLKERSKQSYVSSYSLAVIYMGLELIITPHLTACSRPPR